jgi:hypothetical protein
VSRKLCGLAGAWMLAGLIGAGSASAAAPPTCWQDDAWARPGIQRSYVLYCPPSDQASVASAPDHVAVTDVSLAGDVLHFTLLPDADAAQDETMQVHLSGPTGEATVPIHIHVVPLSVNTAPACAPAAVTQRTDGTGPATFDFHISCTDAEHDDYTLDGGGPGSHPYAPKLVRPAATQEDVGWWRYRTAASVGPEQTTYWATDEFGARSDDASITFDFGPQVDARPTCELTPWGSSTANPLTVLMRPGATRRFGVMCTDADGDDVTAQVTAAPAKGAVTAFADQGTSAGFWGLSRAYDVTYTPGSAFEGQDEFAVTPTGPNGPGAETRIAMVTRTFEQDPGIGGGCGLYRAQTSSGQPVNALARCSDALGDPITGTVVSAPAHGTAGAPVMSPAPFGETDIAVPYTPDADFAGRDFLTLHVTNGGGFNLSMDVSIDVYGHQDLPSIFPPGTTYLDFLAPPPTQPGSPETDAPADLARDALGTQEVRSIGSVGGANVFAPRAALRAVASQPAIAVACRVRCQVGATSDVRIGNRKRRHRRAGRFTSRPGTARAVVLRLGRTERRRLHKVRRASAVFRLTVRAGGRTSVARIALRIHA